MSAAAAEGEPRKFIQIFLSAPRRSVCQRSLSLFNAPSWFMLLVIIATSSLLAVLYIILISYCLLLVLLQVNYYIILSLGWKLNFIITVHLAKG